MHRDVKPDNIRIAADKQTVKFIDFGFSSEWKDKEGKHIPLKEKT